MSEPLGSLNPENMADIQQPEFLPISTTELKKLGINQPDIIFISGDAYVDHPSFAVAILGRMLWNAGFSVAIIAQPDLNSDRDFTRFGRPRLFFAISGGSVDSMVSNFTPALKRRTKDVYSPGGRPVRPDRVVLVYTDIVHRIYPDVPIIIGGVEASLRRFAHYDYWSDRIRQSVLADAPADILVFGMGENAIISIAQHADSGERVRYLQDVRGTARKLTLKEYDSLNKTDLCEIPSFNEVKKDPKAFCSAHILISDNQNPYHGKIVAQSHPKCVIVQNPPAEPLTTRDMDLIYGLPYKRRAHPSYKEVIPALDSVRFSVISHRGCFGNCSFCAISMHQGPIIQSRSKESILCEIETFGRITGFTGVVSDIGGPSADMYDYYCPKWKRGDLCKDKDCITCPSLVSGLSGYLDLLDEAESLPGIKHVFIGSGIRYDLIPHEFPVMSRILDHISGHLKIAPEHISHEITRLMNKPDAEIFESFRSCFEEIQKGRRHRQYIIPYLMSGHPGCTLEDMVLLAEYLHKKKLYPEQVQDFTPTPMTTSTCMYATGINPKTGENVYIPRDREKQIQRAMLRWKDENNRKLVEEALIIAGRKDLIGSRADCLISGVRKGEIANDSRKKAGFPKNQ